jgi:hypothetical protein
MSKPGASVEASQRAAEVRLGGRLAGLSLPRQVLVLALWPLLEQVLAFFVGLTDLLISGRMAEGAERVAVLDAMGLGGYVGMVFQHPARRGGHRGDGLGFPRDRRPDHKLANRGLGQGLWLGIAAGFGSLILLQAGIAVDPLDRPEPGGGGPGGGPTCGCWRFPARSAARCSR